MKFFRIIFFTLLLLLFFAGKTYTQQRDAFDLAMNAEEKVQVEDIINTSKKISKESKEKIEDYLKKWEKLEDDFPHLPKPMQDFINKMNAAGLKSKLRNTLNSLKLFDSGLEAIMKKKEDVDRVIYFYDRYVPDSQNPFRSLEVLNNVFTDAESLLPDEVKYEYIKKPSVWLIRVGLRYFKEATGNALNGLKNLQKQIRNRAGNCIGYVGGDATADKNDPKRKAFTDLNTGDIICYTGLRPKGGEIYTNTNGDGVYIWYNKKWTKFSCGLGQVETVFVTWKQAYGEVISGKNIIYWCNQRLGEFTKAKARAEMQFDKLSSLDYCRQYILNSVKKELDLWALMSLVENNKKLFTAKYIFKKDDVRNKAEMLAKLVSENLILDGYVKNNADEGILYASVEINIGSKKLFARTDKYGYFKLVANVPGENFSELKFEIKVTESNYSDFKTTVTLQEQCMNLGVFKLNSIGQITIQPENITIDKGESVDFTVTFTDATGNSDVTSFALSNSHFTGTSEGVFTVTAKFRGLVANATVDVVGHGCKDNEKWNSTSNNCVCITGFKRNDEGECVPIDSVNNNSVFPPVEITLTQINEMLNNADCANVAGAVANWDPVSEQVICSCTKKFYLWDANQKKCVPDIQAILANSDCSQWPNTEPKWDYGSNEPYCDCIDGYEWNKDYSECLSKQDLLVAQTDCSQYPNTHPVWDPVNNEVVCDCLPGYEWNDDYTKCISKELANLQSMDCSMYPNTEPVWDPVSNQAFCDCSPGYEWNEEYSACEPIQQQQVQYDCSHLPNSRPIFDPVLNETVCDCMPGFKWNGNQTACIPIPRKPTVNWGNIINMTVGVLNAVNGNNQGITSQHGLGGVSAQGLPQSMQPPVMHQSNCNDQQQAGGNAPEVHTIDLGQSFGSFMFDYNTYTAKDQIIVTNGGQTIFNSGCVGESKSIRLNLNGFSPTITVSVNPNCDGGSNTQWNFTVHCPGHLPVK
jgi:hypothetical protein